MPAFCPDLTSLWCWHFLGCLLASANDRHQLSNTALVSSYVRTNYLAMTTNLNSFALTLTCTYTSGEKTSKKLFQVYSYSTQSHQYWKGLGHPGSPYQIGLGGWKRLRNRFCYTLLASLATWRSTKSPERVSCSWSKKNISRKWTPIFSFCQSSTPTDGGVRKVT